MRSRILLVILLSMASLSAACADNASSPAKVGKTAKETKTQAGSEQARKQIPKPSKSWSGKPIYIKKLTEQQPLRTRMRNEIKNFVNSNGQAPITGVDTVK